MNKINFKRLLEATGSKLDLWHIVGLHNNAKNWAGAVAGPDAEKISDKLKFTKSDEDAKELVSKIVGKWKNYEITKNFLPTLKHLLVTNPALKEDYEEIKDLLENYEYIMQEVKDGDPSIHLIKFIKQVANAKNPAANFNLPEKKVSGPIDSDDSKKIASGENSPRVWFNIAPKGRIAELLKNSGIKKVPEYSAWIKGIHPLSGSPILLYLALQDENGDTVKGRDLEKRVFILIKDAIKNWKNNPKVIIKLIKNSKIAGLPSSDEIDDWLAENKNVPNDLVRGWHNSTDCFDDDDEDDDDCSSGFLNHLKRYASLMDSKEAKKKFYDNALSWTQDDQKDFYKREFKNFINEALGQFEQPGGLSWVKEKYKSLKNKFSLGSGDKEYVDKLVHIYNALVSKYRIGNPIKNKDSLYQAISRGDNLAVSGLVDDRPEDLALIRIAQSAAFPGTNREGNQPIVGEKEFKRLFTALKTLYPNVYGKSNVEALALDIGNYIHGEKMQILVDSRFKNDLEQYQSAKSMSKQSKLEAKVNNMKYVGKIIALRLKNLTKEPDTIINGLTSFLQKESITRRANNEIKLARFLEEIIDGLNN